MKMYYSLYLLLISLSISAQDSSKMVKIIPEMSLKIGSQQPAIGGQFGLVAGMLFNQKYFAGIGGGYVTNMGMGGGSFPLFLDGRYYFGLPKNFIFLKKDQRNDFQIDIQVGMDINNNTPFKTGFLMGIGLAYRFDFIKIKEWSFFPFYFGFNIEYKRNPFQDEYLGYVIKDGTIKHIMLNLKIAFDIKAIKMNLGSKKTK